MSKLRINPTALHLVNIEDVRKLYAGHSGRSPNRSTVTRWLTRRKLTGTGPNDKQRLFDRAAVIAALEADFKSEPQFIKVEDAFYLAGMPYPKARNKGDA